MTISVAETMALDIEKKAMKRCARRSPLRSWLAWVYCGVFLTSFSVFFVFWCTNSLHDYVLSQLVLRNGTRNFAWWQQPPVNLLCKFYIFNYTNIDDYMSYRADRLRVQDVGPYIYRETLNRVNIESEENGTVSYQEERSYEYVGGRPEDEFVQLPNLPLMYSTAYVRDMGFAAQLGLTTMLSTLREKPFIRETTSGFFWGYENRFFHLIKPFFKLEHDISMDKFGMLAMKAGVNRDRITMHTGLRDLGSLGMIQRVNGMTSRDIWNDERCDKIDGTDGSRFPPHLIKDANQTLTVYMKDLCRSLPFRFSEHATAYGIPVLRYNLPIDAFNYSDPRNRCFCQEVQGSRVCPPTGFHNISACNQAPLLISFPHFYGVDKSSLIEPIDGLNTEEEFESYMDVHPVIAIPIAARTRIQLNVQVQRATGVPFLGRLKDGAILPLFWMTAEVDEMPEPVLEILEDAYFTVAAVEAVFQWCSLIVMILSLGALIVCLRKHRMEQLSALRSSSSAQDKLLELS